MLEKATFGAWNEWPASEPVTKPKEIICDIYQYESINTHDVNGVVNSS